MPLLNDIHSIIVPTTSANFTAHTYTEIYAANNDTVILNGISVQLGGGSSIKIKISSISGGTSSYLLGENINNRQDARTLGGTYL